MFWIEAETEETASSRLVHIADILQLPERQEANQQCVVAAVQRWLKNHNGWLIIWDNVGNLDVLSRLLPATELRQESMCFPFAWPARVREKRFNTAWKIYESGPFHSYAALTSSTGFSLASKRKIYLSG